MDFEDIIKAMQENNFEVLEEKQKEVAQKKTWKPCGVIADTIATTLTYENFEKMQKIGTDEEYTPEEIKYIGELADVLLKLRELSR